MPVSMAVVEVRSSPTVTPTYALYRAPVGCSRRLLVIFAGTALRFCACAAIGLTLALNRRHNRLRLQRPPLER